MFCIILQIESSPYQAKSCFLCLTLVETCHTILVKDMWIENNFTKMCLFVLSILIHSLPPGTVERMIEFIIRTI